MSNIQQFDQTALNTLFEHGASTPDQLAEANEIDQFEKPAAHEWVISAEQRGLIEQTEGSGGSRYNITDAGRSVIGQPSGR